MKENSTQHGSTSKRERGKPRLERWICRDDCYQKGEDFIRRVKHFTRGKTEIRTWLNGSHVWCKKGRYKRRRARTRERITGAFYESAGYVFKFHSQLIPLCSIIIDVTIVRLVVNGRYHFDNDRYHTREIYAIILSVY